MKIFKYGLPLAALAMLASCSNDNVVAPSGDDVANAAKGDMYMSLYVQPAGSRAEGPYDTETGRQGSEVGKDFENKVTSAIIVLATSTDETTFTIWKTFPVGVNDIDTDGKATFQYDRETLKTEVGGTAGSTKDVYVFVVANPTTEISSKFTGTSVQQTISLTNDGNDWWTNDKFLMSNSELFKATIKYDDILDGHNTADTAYPLQEYKTSNSEEVEKDVVKIQRAMSRLDIDPNTAYTDFTVGENELSVNIDAVALVNQATVAELFKVTHVAPTANEWSFTSGLTLAFTSETKTNYVWSAEQEAFTHPLFDGSTVSNGVLTGSAQFPALFNDASDYATIADLRSNSLQDNDFKYPNDTPYESDGAYRIWRYVMENTNYNAENQLRGNTTAIVFRAEISGENVPTPEEGDEAIYAYDDVIIGDALALLTYASNPKNEEDETSIYEAVALRYQAAVDAALANTSLGKWTSENWDKLKEQVIKNQDSNDGQLTVDDLSDLDTYLVSQKFSIYRPTEVSEDGGGSAYKYYCYYVYYNRHNNNGNDIEMGPMEFATVRNNIYKIKVTDVAHLGHPGVPADDPDPEKPDDPVEKDQFHFSVQCTVIDWEVRMNDIKF